MQLDTPPIVDVVQQILDEKHALEMELLDVFAALGQDPTPGYRSAGDAVRARLAYLSNPNILNAEAAAINEVLLGFELCGGQWFDEDAGRYFNEHAMKLPRTLYEQQAGRARAMASAVLEWARQRGYTEVERTHWTVHGRLQSAVARYLPDVTVDPKRNPTDILIKFTDGPHHGLLGVSAKSSKRGEVCFKNPGVGSIERALGLELTALGTTAIVDAINVLGLSIKAAERKKQIRADEDIAAQTRHMGSYVLNQIRDAVLAKFRTMNGDDLAQHLLTYWLDADEMIPPYVRCTGMGTKAPYRVKLSDPADDPIIAHVRKGNIAVFAYGDQTIGVSANGIRIMRIRPKWESEKLASSLKFVAEPW